MKAAELRDLSETDLREHIHTARRELVGLRFQNATGELDNTAQLARGQAGHRPCPDRRQRARHRNPELLMEEIDETTETVSEEAAAPVGTAREFRGGGRQPRTPTQARRPHRLSRRRS